MILHCVFCDFIRDVGKTGTDGGGELLQELKDFSLSLPGVLSFDFGPNRDFEKKSPNHSDGFVIRFATAEALENYALHPTHLALGARLCGLCRGGAEGIIVYDLEVPG